MIVFAAAVLAYFGLAFSNTVWYDEAYTMAMIKHTFSDICSITAQDVHPPLYYILLKIFAAPFGYSIFAAKVFSIIPHLLLIVLGYIKLTEFFDRKTGFLFALMTAFLPIMTTYAVELRMYGWAALFVTGCALFFYPELLDEQGHLLTERFFFGEEDFEFSMRMKEKKVPMACILDSVIYHKVGASGCKMNHLGKVYLHYLNRFIDIRLHKSAFFYLCWAMVNMPFCLHHFYKSSHSLVDAFGLIFRLFVDVNKKDGVTYEDFKALVIDNNYFNKI